MRYANYKFNEANNEDTLFIHNRENINTKKMKSDLSKLKMNKD